MTNTDWANTKKNVPVRVSRQKKLLNVLAKKSIDKCKRKSKDMLKELIGSKNEGYVYIAGIRFWTELGR